MQAPCGPQSCEGCCTNNFCIVTSQQNSFVCGAQGSACAMCMMGQVCTNGACVARPACDASTCPNGCCQNGQCQSGNSRMACGSGGQACQRCMNNVSCTNQSCGGAPNPDAGSGSLTGQPCTTTQQCQPPQNGLCVQENLFGQNSGYVGGYCSATCSAMQPCAAGATCVTESVFGQVQSTCRATCAAPGTQSTCRAGYVCQSGANSTSPAFCRARCDNGGLLSACPANQMCNATTGACQ